MQPSLGTEVIGWFSSVVLLLTISRQIYKQWHDGQSDGVSLILFIGQITASFGFTIYSFLVQNWVFVVTNAMMLCGGILGLTITIYHRNKSKDSEQ